jgi:hypothetical protein
MLHAFQKTSLIYWRKITKILLVVILGLVVSQFLFLFLLFNKEQHWILVPQFDHEKSASLSSKNFSDEYLIAWCDGLCRTILCVNTATIEGRMKEILNISSPRYFGSLEEALKKERDELRKNSISTAFYPQKFTVHKSLRKVEVEGVFHTYFSQDKSPVVEKKRWIVGWERGALGAILLTHFEEERQEK